MKITELSEQLYNNLPDIRSLRFWLGILIGFQYIISPSNVLADGGGSIGARENSNGSIPFSLIESIPPRVLDIITNMFRSCNFDVDTPVVVIAPLTEGRGGYGPQGTILTSSTRENLVSNDIGLPADSLLLVGMVENLAGGSLAIENPGGTILRPVDPVGSCTVGVGSATGGHYEVEFPFTVSLVETTNEGGAAVVWRAGE